ncbi:D-alanyl-D-alanine carboxypeptidase family protein [Photobacterium gaetbulicola]|uniref:Putative D,D-carboxypeptidase-related protein n=1 Tax=Photobacterium gaetbulicola Gung47 TaxID=658445 RepID=A0A0C5WX84_9GAMM|nr:M15 family metallopeptidase [Photobacterium gaetbulicola]AJR09639.1 putative D,D-carboxypeptidase-related protein [Photobacterium gaetbulicola Gung47]PSU06459.1 D-alanyl-D-alanine carboxypeptidase family protein [Photobacterium gaetbulicola]
MVNHPIQVRQHTAGQLTGQETSHLVSLHPDGGHPFVHRQMLAAFEALKEAANKAGFDLQVASAFRPFERQLLIWNNKYTGKRPLLDSNSQPLDPSALTELDKVHAIMRWSALPGASRHHWGTDIDVYAANCLPKGEQLHLEPWEYQPGGHQAAFSQWLSGNMAHFGFYLPYAEDRHGVACEPWHISYFPVSKYLLSQLTPDLLKRTLSQSELAGKSHILENLDSLYSRYIENICEV